MTATISAQVVNHGSKAQLPGCLSRLLATRNVTEIHVLENASGDDLSDLEAEFAGRVRFHASTVNVGFGAGHNRLAGLGSSELICCVNPDALAPDTAGMARLAGHFGDPRVAAVGPALRTGEGDLQMWDHGELRGVRARIANGAGHAHWRPRPELTDVAWVSGAFLLLRRSAFEAVGGFDERFFLYKEEEDLCLHLRRRGGRVVYDPRVEVRHAGGSRDAAVMATSRAHFNAKNFPARRRRAALEWLYLNVSRRF